MTPTDYYPTKVKFTKLPNKISLLTWQQHGHSRQKLLTRQMALKMANSNDTPKELRSVLFDAFQAGEVQ